MAWCHLERCEIELASLHRHHTPTNEDPQKIGFISRMVPRWQSLYPYKMFLSPEILKKEVLCSICGARVVPRSSCGHRKHNVYGGRLCFHKVVDAAFIGLSLVTDPVQKYSVAFTSDENGNQVDHYNYDNVLFVSRRVASAWDEWISERTVRTIGRQDVAHVDLSAPCPCCSGKEFGPCCAGKDALEIPHLQIAFAVPPPADLPNLELLC
jgi:hypothetical protein